MGSAMEQFNVSLTEAYKNGNIEEFMRLLDNPSCNSSVIPTSHAAPNPVPATAIRRHAREEDSVSIPSGVNNRSTSRRKRGPGARRVNGSNRVVDMMGEPTNNGVETKRESGLCQVNRARQSGPSRLQPNAAVFVPSSMQGKSVSNVDDDISQITNSVESISVEDAQNPASMLAARVQAEAVAAGLDAVGASMYSEAMTAFDSAFPALGGNSTDTIGQPADAMATHNDLNHSPTRPLLEKMRLDRLNDQFPWVDPVLIEASLESANGSLAAAESIVAIQFPKPPNWDAMVEAKRAETLRQQTVSALPNQTDVRRTKDIGGHWVATGSAVSSLYESLREKAGEEARIRNALFDRAKAAVDRGDHNEARRLGALGRDANIRMKKLHDQAADSIFEARNPNGFAGHIDLHGLHVAEAIDRLPYAMDSAVGGSVRILTGSGHHTKGTGKARLRPAVQKWLQNNNYAYEEVVDSNAHIGAFVVKLNARK